MLDRIFPEQFDNHYRGRKGALWLFYPITFMNVAIDLVAIFARDGGAKSADAIPLDTFGPTAAAALVGVVAYLGLASLLLGLLAILALLRYRAMIPLMYLLIVMNDIGHKAIGLIKPIARIGAPSGGIVSLALMALSLVGLVLAVSGKGYLARAASARP